jgi:hypothetical protein
LLECGYPRIAIQIRYLGKVIPPVFPLGKLRQEFARAVESSSRGCATMSAGRPCYRLSENS